MSSAATADKAPDVDLNDHGQPKRSPCVQPIVTLAEYSAECGPCGPETPHGALWREFAVAAAEPAVALPMFPSPSQVTADGEPTLMMPIVDKPRLSTERSSADSAILGKRMLVMLVVPEKRDTAVADVRRLIAGEDLAEAAAWAFYEVGVFALATFLNAGWWHAPTARDLALYRAASDHILDGFKSSAADEPANGPLISR